MRLDTAGATRRGRACSCPADLLSGGDVGCTEMPLLLLTVAVSYTATLSVCFLPVLLFNPHNCCLQLGSVTPAVKLKNLTFGALPEVVQGVELDGEDGRPGISIHICGFSF